MPPTESLCILRLEEIRLALCAPELGLPRRSSLGFLCERGLIGWVDALALAQRFTVLGPKQVIQNLGNEAVR